MPSTAYPRDSPQIPVADVEREKGRLKACDSQVGTGLGFRGLGFRV